MTVYSSRLEAPLTLHSLPAPSYPGRLGDQIRRGQRREFPLLGQLRRASIMSPSTMARCADTELVSERCGRGCIWAAAAPGGKRGRQETRRRAPGPLWSDLALCRPAELLGAPVNSLSAPDLLSPLPCTRRRRRSNLRICVARVLNRYANVSLGAHI